MLLINPTESVNSSHLARVHGSTTMSDEDQLATNSAFQILRHLGFPLPALRWAWRKDVIPGISRSLDARDQSAPCNCHQNSVLALLPPAVAHFLRDYMDYDTLELFYRARNDPIVNLTLAQSPPDSLAARISAPQFLSQVKCRPAHSAVFNSLTALHDWLKCEYLIREHP